MTKAEQLSKLPEDFLRNLAQNLNGDYFSSYRNYSNLSHSELVEKVSRKLKVEEVEEVLNRYDDSDSVEKIAGDIKPDSVDMIEDAVEGLFCKKGRKEVKVGRRRCDLVFIDELIAIEIKSARDKIKKGIEQTEYYKKWADEVYLAYDQELKNRVPDHFRNNGVGLIEYSNGDAQILKRATKHKTNPQRLLSWMIYSELSSAARKYGVKPKGKKEEIAQKLSGKISEKEAVNIFKNYLEGR